ncbi:MAG: 50S ribosomal protein L5 [Phycisphaerales bacterium]|jgi:large subunit ribosomal protein L5
MAKNKPNQDDPAIKAAAAPREGMQRLRKRYLEDARAEVTKQFGVTNPMAMPVLDRIVINVNMGRFLDGPKIPPNVRATVVDTLTQITGQKPVVVKAKKSVSNFKVREGMETSAMVTMRGDRMWDFLDRFINLATPRIKDFRGVSDSSFDKAGNYSLGLNEQGVFPEINMANVTFTHGMNINFVFRNSDKAKSRAVLESLGMPFRKPAPPKKKAS